MSNYSNLISLLETLSDSVIPARGYLQPNDQRLVNGLVDLGLVTELQGFYVLTAVVNLMHSPDTLMDLNRERISPDGRAISFDSIRFERLA